MVLCFLSGDKKGLRDRNSPICTLSQNGYGTDQGIISMHHGLPPLPLEASPWFHLSSNIPPPHRNTDFMGSGSLPSSPAALFSIRGACSVAASYKPPMLVTRVQLPACACGAPLAGTHMRVRVYGSSAPSSAGRWRWWQCCCCLNSWAGSAPQISISTLPGPPACPHHHRVAQLAHDRTCSQDLPGRCRHS